MVFRFISLCLSMYSDEGATSGVPGGGGGETGSDLFMPEFKYFKNNKFKDEANLLAHNPAKLINLQGLTPSSLEEHGLQV